MATKKAKKKVAKKAPAKKVAKKVSKKVTKKATKKAPAKRTTKKVAKKATKKAVAKRATATKIVVPPVPVSSSRATAKVIDTKPAQVPVSKPAVTSSKKEGGSNRVVIAVVIGLLAIGAIALSKGSSSSETPKSEESAMPTASASESTSGNSVATTAAPLGIVAHYTADGATIFWNATTAADGLKGYSVEFRANGGTWNEVAMVGTDVTKYDITKSDTTGWTSFKISAVYADGQKAEGKVFGLPGQYK